MTLGDESLLRDVVSSVVHAAGFDLEDLLIQGVGRRRVVRVIVDRDGGTDLDAAAAVSRALSDELDGLGETLLGGAAYTLEVTSPGVGRPLTLPRHFRRAAGRLATVTRVDGSTLQARILGVDGDGVALLTGPDGLRRSVVPFAQIGSARVEVEFGPPPAPVVAVLAANGVGVADAGGGEGGPTSEGAGAR